MIERALEEIVGFTIVANDLGRLVAFYHDVLGFALEGDEQRIEAGEMALLGLQGGGRRRRFRLGTQTMSIDHYDLPGRPYPAGGDAASLWFQHLAVVVDDIQTAYHRVRACVPISENGPQHLPRSSGGVHAYKFRDPEGHPLELLQFDLRQADIVWGGSCLPGEGGLGIDHSAISVRDAATSIEFYQRLGLDTGERTLNAGPVQQRLDNLRDVEVAVVPLLPRSATPHLELLSYLTPKRDGGPTSGPNDVAATRIVWRGAEAGLLRDPDGHLHQIET